MIRVTGKRFVLGKREFLLQVRGNDRRALPASPRLTPPNRTPLMPQLASDGDLGAVR